MPTSVPTGSPTPPQPPKWLDELCLSLPEAQLVRVEAWGSEPTYRVNNKIFCFGGTSSLMLKLGREAAAAVIAVDPRCSKAPYIGRHGWVSVDITGVKRADCDQVTEWVLVSYRLVAPKRLAGLV